MPFEPATRGVTFVVKTSKLCNLRCRYCYEMEDLGKKDRISLENLRSMYKHISDYYHMRDRRDGEHTKITFNWHGGEPLLVEPAFYWQTFADQAEIFAGRVECRNSVQTNLVAVDDERIRLLRDGFDGVGVSLDLFGDLRVNFRGREMQHKVLANMDRLKNEGIPFGCITVLHRANINHVDRIWRFYERAGLGFRVLPISQGADAEQNTPFSLSAQEITTAFCRLIDLWLTSDRPVPILPLKASILAVMRHVGGGDGKLVYYNKADWCQVILVNTNGELYTVGDPYGETDWAIGNIFAMPLGDIFAGEVFHRSVRETEKRLAANCVNCPFFGSCDGRVIGDEWHTHFEHRDDGIPICTLERTVLAHLEQRLRNASVIDDLGAFVVPVPEVAV